MIPDNELDPTIRYERFLPYYAVNKQPRIDVCKAGIAIGDLSEGFDFQLWKARLSKTGDVTIAAESSNFKDETLLFNVGEIGKISLAFDEAMQPLITLVRDETLYLYDSEGTAILTVENVRDALIRIDDVRAISDSSRDCILSYIREGNFYYTYSSESYETEYFICEAHEWQRIFQCGMSENLRFQFILVWDPKLIGACA